MTGVFAGKRIQSVTVGSAFACALTTDSTLACWGARNFGKIGDDEPASGTQGPPAQVALPPLAQNESVRAVEAGTNHACALTSLHEVYCWGQGTSGELGNGASVSSSTPVRVQKPAGLQGKAITKLRLSPSSSSVVTADGDVWSWGMGRNYTLGNGLNADSSVPVAIVRNGPLVGAKLVDVTRDGYSRICVLSEAGETYCAGYTTSTNSYLGVKNRNPVTTPTRLDETAGFTHRFSELTSANNMICGRGDGVVRCWGLNSSGSFGNGSTSPSADAVFGLGVVNEPITQFSQGSANACALTASGAAWCAGRGTSGELGDGSIVTSQPIPVRVATPTRG